MALAKPQTTYDPVRASKPGVERLITPECREEIRREIADSDGCEVFFIGRLNAERVVEEVEPYAFGNRQAVPALLQYARPGEVVIHNHPSGNMEPSDADIAVSSELGSRGVGSYIVNNDCSAVRQIVRAFEPPAHKPIDIEKLKNWLRSGGRLAERLDGYEERPQQVDMLEAVAEAFNRDGLAVIEAATGTGKSLAYLLPAIAWAIRNNEKIVISTGTINLQEQLISKDLPLLIQALGLKFDTALMKGRGNYLCRRKAQYLKQNPDFLSLSEPRSQLAEIQAWIKTTQDGSREDLAFTPDDGVWESVMSEADNCLRTRCPFYEKCFFYNARRKAARAHVLVVNHHLLMSDLAVRAETDNYRGTAVLPAFHRLIIDEAHHLEEVATGYFGARTSRGTLHYVMRRLVVPRTGEGLLTYLAGKIHEGVYDLSPSEHDALLVKLGRELPLMHHELLTAMDEGVARVADWFEQQSDVSLDKPLELKHRVKEEDAGSEWWREEVDKPLRAVLVAARPYLDALREVGRALVRFLEDAAPVTATPILELQSSLNKIETVINKLIRFLGEAKGRCRWLEYRRRGGRRPADMAFCVAPLDMAVEIRERLLRRCKTVVMTSATLAVERNFNYFMRQIGADDPLMLGLQGTAALDSAAESEGDPEPGNGNGPGAGEPAAGGDGTGGPSSLTEGGEHDPGETEDEPPTARHLSMLLLDTPFDYARQVYVGIPMDLPDPTVSDFDGPLAEFLGPALEASRGRAFVLFTAYSLLGRVFDRLAPWLEQRGFPCLRQGQSGRSMLTEAFRNEIGSVLFATSSFWEGVDVPGEALSCLVLTRLPFRVPGDPLTDARIENLRCRRLDPFEHLIIPEAVIRFRQGFGRLIRNRSDRGAVLICDRRVGTKHYGRAFLGSLPTGDFHFAEGDQVLTALREFFSR